MPAEQELVRQRESAATARNIAVGALHSIVAGASDPKAVAVRALNELKQVYDLGIDYADECDDGEARNG